MPNSPLKTGFFGVAIIVFSVSLFLRADASHPHSDVIQFHNLVIQSVSGTSLPAEITATPKSTSKKCIRFPSVDAERGETVDCPTPGVPYRIAIDKETILLLRAREKGTLGDFAAGDEIHIFGLYDTDGTIRGLVVRNLLKPISKYYVQLNNVEVIGLAGGMPRTLVVVHRPEAGCDKFEGNRKFSASCPTGLPSLGDGPVSRGIAIPEYLKVELASMRKYEITITSKTLVLDRTRKRIDVTALAVGDKLNVYGSHIEKDGRLIEAEVVRDLSKPEAGVDTNRYDGIITRINASDGSFIIRTRHGRLLEIVSPLQIGSFVTVRGAFDQLKNILASTTEVIVKDQYAEDAIPVISQVSPGAGPVGTLVTLTGSGFTAKGNSINFAGVQGARENLSSPDGRTLSFTIPTTPCPEGSEVACAQAVLTPGAYELSVTNKNGTSDSTNFQVMELPPFSIITLSLPQAVQGARYSAVVEGRGGADSYTWNISSGSLPPGLELKKAVCVAFPCKAPLTIFGIPTTPGVYTFTLTLISGLESTVREYRLVVVQAINTGY